MYIRLIRIPKKATIRKTVKIWDGNLINPTTRQIPLERRYHPYKYESLLSFFGFYKIPNNRTIIINPPPTQRIGELTESQKEYWDVFVEGFKKLSLALAVAPDVIKKYPSIPVTREAISSMFEVLLKTFDTVIDDRWDKV